MTLTGGAAIGSGQGTELVATGTINIDGGSITQGEGSAVLIHDRFTMRREGGVIMGPGTSLHSNSYLHLSL